VQCPRKHRRKAEERKFDILMHAKESKEYMEQKNNNNKEFYRNMLAWLIQQKEGKKRKERNVLNRKPLGLQK